MGLSRVEREQLQKRVNTMSGGLIEVAPGIVQIIHESIREFFHGPQGLGVLKYTSEEPFSRSCASHNRVNLLQSTAR